MSDYKKNNPEQESAFTVEGAEDYFLVPKKIINLIKCMSESEIKLFLYLCANKSCTCTEAKEVLGLSKEAFEGACGYIRGAKLFERSAASAGEYESTADEPKKKMAQASLIQSYDGEVIAEALEKSAEFKFVAQVAAECLGKPNLNRNELNSLYNLFDYVRLDANFICGVIHYCASRGKISMQYIMKTALSLADSGISTYEQLEEYLKKKEEAGSEISKFKNHCGFGNRALTSKEEKFFVRWFEEMRYSFEVVRLAYEITVDKTHELSFNYMGKILENWFAAGYRTVEDIQKSAKKPKTNSTNDSFDVDDFVAAALKKSGY